MKIPYGNIFFHGILPTLPSGRDPYTRDFRLKLMAAVDLEMMPCK